MEGILHHLGPNGTGSDSKCCLILKRESAVFRFGNNSGLARTNDSATLGSSEIQLGLVMFIGHAYVFLSPRTWP